MKSIKSEKENKISRNLQILLFELTLNSCIKRYNGDKNRPKVYVVLVLFKTYTLTINNIEITFLNS